MKKLLTLFCLMVSLAFAVKAEVTIQGVPVYGRQAEMVHAAQLMKVSVPGNAETFKFSDIKNWTGEGDCEAAFVLQWNIDGEENAMVWGYRWNSSETKTGVDMLFDIVAADPKLYVLAQLESDYGPAIGGFGYDVDGNGDLAVQNSKGTELKADESGIIAVDNYAFDNNTPKDATDYWQSGWNSGYWNYWIGESSSFSVIKSSGVGAASRVLKDGSVDMWNWAAGYSAKDWKDLAAAPAVETKPALPAEFTDGFFIQNEDWFGHAKSSINWVASDGTVYYNVDNKANGDTEVLGNTSQFGTIYGGNYYVTSKQQPRFVIFDATTLAKKESYDYLGTDSSNAGDGRDVCAVSDDKIYVGGNNGISVYSLSDQSYKWVIAGTSDNYEIGTIVRVGKYVFAVMERNGVLVIDPEKDEVISKLGTEYKDDVTALVVSKDGNLWVDAGAKILRINPVTLEEKAFDLAHSASSSFAYPAKIFADFAENALYYTSGKSLYKLLIDEDGNIAEDSNFSLTLPARDGKQLIFYGAPRIDPKSGNIIATTQWQWSNSNWVDFINPRSGAIEKTITLLNDDGKGYYWFPSLPIFPDNEAPEILLDDIVLSKNAVIYPITELVSDADDLAALAVVEKSETDNFGVVNVDYDGMNIVVTPIGNGTANLGLTVNSNGKKVSKTVPVTVSGLSSVIETVKPEIAISMVGDQLHVRGVASGTATVYNMTGTVVANADLSTVSTIDLSGVAAGTYIVNINSGNDNKSEKVMIF